MTTKLTFLLALCLVLGALMVACGSGADNTATTNGATASGDKIGVAECDEFITKYESCITGKVPAAQQAAFKSSIETWRKSWKDLAANPQTKGTLAQTCKTQLESAKTSLSSFGCSW